MNNSAQSNSEDTSEDEQLDKNVEFLIVIKDNKITSVVEKKKEIDDALANGANVNFQDQNFYKRTPLYYAVKKGEKEIVYHLLNNGAKVITEDRHANPLACAEKLKQISISGSAVEQNYIEIIDALKHEISRNNPQPSTSQSQTSKPSASILTDGGSKKTNIKHSNNQTDEPNKKFKNDLLKTSETYEASGLKSTLHGVMYQLKLLMFFGKRFYDKGYQFKLATEMVIAEKFDDVVLEFVNPNDNIKHFLFLHANHIYTENNEINKIHAKDLLTMSDSLFSLQKYFRSFQKIVKNDKFKNQNQKYFMIYTNVDFLFDYETVTLKKLTPLYFEPYYAKMDLFNVEFNKDVKKGKFYKLVGSDHVDERKEVVDVLTSLFQQTTDMHKLAKELSEHLIQNKTIGLNNSLFKEYRAALVKEVIDIHDNKLRKEFIDLDSSLSSGAINLRAILFKLSEKTLNDKKKHSVEENKLPEILKNNDQIFFWNEVGKLKLKISNGFKKKLTLDYLFENPKKLAESQIVDKIEVENFINDLIFAVNQPNEDQLGEITKKEIGAEFNLIDSELVTHDFTKRMLDWLKTKEGTYITETSIDSFLEKDLREKFAQLVLIGPTSVHIEKLKKTNIVFELHALPDLLLNFLNQSNDKSPIRYKFCHFDTTKTSPLLGSVKVNQTLKQIKEYYSCDDSFISFDLNTLLSISDRVLKSFKNENVRLLIVECNSQEKIDEKLNELKIHLDNFNQKRLILIGPTDNALIEKFCYYYSESHLKIEDESHFKDLTEISQEHVLNSRCKFQEYEVVLNQLFDKNQRNITNTITLANLLNNENKFKIGKPISSFVGYDKNYFIERTFWQELQKNPKDLYKSGRIPKTNYFSEETFLGESGKDPNNALKPARIRKTLNDLLQQLKQNSQKKIIIISDVAGMGKSTILTHLSHEIKEQSPNHWIVKIELSRHADAFKDCTSFTTESAIDFISNKILKIQKPFEKQLFKYLFGKKKVALLLDAFDEISPIYVNTVLDLLESLKNTENQLWITTRPNLKESLGKNQKDRVVFYNLEPFSQDDQIVFLTKFWSEKCNLQNKKKVEIYAKALIENLTKSIKDDKFTGIPLQTRMLAEAFKDEVSTFHNESTKIETIFEDKFDILGLYEKFYKAKFDLAFQKGTVIEDDAYNIYQKYGLGNVYRNLALLMLFPDQECFLNIEKQELLSLPITRFGIAETSDRKKIQFIHRTFAEYSVAEFFTDALTNYEPKKVCSFFLTIILLDDNCRMIRYFIDCFLKKNSISEEYLKQYGEQIDTLWKDKTYKEKNIKTIFHAAAREGNSHIVKFLSKSLKDNYIETLKSLLEARNNNQLAWHEAAKGGHVEVLEVLWEWAKYFKLDLKNLLLEVGSDEETAWVQASKNNHFDILKKLWQWAQDIKQSFVLKKNLLLSKDSFYKRNAFHFATANKNIGTLQTLKDWASEIECDFKNDLLLSKDNNGQTAFHLATMEGHVEVLKILRDWATVTNCDFKNDLLLSKDNNGHLTFHLAAMEGHVVNLKYLRDWASEIECDFKNDLLLFKDNNGQTAFHLATMEGHVEVLKMLLNWATQTECDFKNDLLLSKDVNGQTPFHLAAMEGHVENLKYLRDWASETESDFKNDFLLCKNYKKQNMFHLAAEKGGTEVLKIILDWAMETDADFESDLLLSKNNIGQTAFHLAAVKGHVEVLKILRNLATETNADFKNDFLLSKNYNGQNAFHLAAEEGHVDVLKILLDWATETECDFKNDLLLLKNYNGQNAFHLAAEEGHIEVLKMLRDWATETECDIRNDLLLSKDIDGQTAFHQAAGEGHVKILKMLRNWAIEFDCNFINNLLLSKNNHGQNLFHMASKKGHVTVLKLILDWATETKTDFKMDLLLSTDNENQTAFHLAIVKGNDIVLIMLWNWASETNADFKKDLLLSKNYNGQTAFHMAAEKGHVIVLNLIINWATEIKCDIRNVLLLFKDNIGQTAFHLAALNGHVEVLKLLRDWATETNCDFKNDLLLSKNNNGQTAFHLAAWRGRVEVLKIIRDWATKTECDFKNDLLLSKDNYGQTAFHLAAWGGHFEVLKILKDWATETKCNFRNDLLLPKDKNGDAAFHLAAERGHVEILKILEDWIMET